MAISLIKHDTRKGPHRPLRTIPRENRGIDRTYTPKSREELRSGYAELEAPRVIAKQIMREVREEREKERRNRGIQIGDTVAYSFEDGAG